MTTKRNRRWFPIFGEADGVQVHESSNMVEGAHCWARGGRAIGNDGRSGVMHLSVQQARILIRALRKFVSQAESGNLTEPESWDRNDPIENKTVTPSDIDDGEHGRTRS